MALGDSGTREWQLLPQTQLPDDIQKSPVDHSVNPYAQRIGEGSRGSNLNGNLE